MKITLKRIVQKLKLRYGSDETVSRTLREMGMRVGENTRIYTLRIPGEAYLVRVGNHCAISPDVTLVTHNANFVYQHKHESLTGFGCIDIKDNVHICVNATIMPNVTIGPNAIVGACSVVTKDVEPYTVVAGNPARVMCTLDEYEEKCLEMHIDLPKDRKSMQKVLEQHFWGDEE